MCGIFGIHGVQQPQVSRSRAIALSKRLRHRGPDWSGCYVGRDCILAHERLAIVGVDTGAQPLTSEDEKQILSVNGEIYNYLALKKTLPADAKFKTHSDCEVILHLYKKHDPSTMCGLLDGMFSFILLDESVEPSRLIVARDPIAVRKRLMSEVPYGVLLSGGLDSSLIASIAARETERVAVIQMEERRRKLLSSGTTSPIGSPTVVDGTLVAWPQLHSFSVGLPNSPDLLAARKVAGYLGTHHHEFTFTVQEGIDAIPEVIYHLETYDVTTVRASTPMYLLSRKIKAMGVKMVLSGEGSDEILGGYLYFHAAPDAASFHEETVKRVQNLHTSDCLRANKSTMAWGLEARVPFLDKAFLDVAMTINPEQKMFGKGAEQQVDGDGCPIMEKYIIRKAFDIAPDGKPYLPKSILWRQKEQFSDGVGYSWIDG
ncbi:asparagine synthetase [Serendipita sp. 405]|nr:asparagine synthetase [Serendipita sp. 405]